MTGQFGCAQCYSEDANVVYQFLHNGGLKVSQFLIRESHFIVSVGRCCACGQAFVSIFTEFIDWIGSDDAQYSDLVPVTSGEVETLQAQGEKVDLRFLGSLGEGRRRLWTDWPSGGSKRIGWGIGAFEVHEGD